MDRAVFTVLLISLAWVSPAEASLTWPGSDAPMGVTKKAVGEQHATCGSRGGPGYRKANGKCASWRR